MSISKCKGEKFMTQLLRRLPIEANDVVVRGQRYRSQTPANHRVGEHQSSGPRRLGYARSAIPCNFGHGQLAQLYDPRKSIDRMGWNKPQRSSAIKQHTRFGKSNPFATGQSILAPEMSAACETLGSDATPFSLLTDKGIAVCSDNHPSDPRLPLLGLRLLVRNKLILTVNGSRNEVSLCTGPWWWPF